MSEWEALLKEKVIPEVKKEKKARPSKPQMSKKDKIIQSIIDYKGIDPDLISLRYNWLKSGPNGDYSRRHILNTIKIIMEEGK